jgi:pentapeptide MXKDX repeat protein
MRKWTSVLALAIAGALVATMAFAQSTSDPGKSGGMKSDTMKSDTMKSDMSKDRGMRAGRGGDRGQTKAIQQALKDKGHDPGAVDGVMGPKTRSALRDFQKKEGIKDTGRPDRETMSKLGVEAKTSSISEPSPGTSASPAMPSPGAKDPSPSAKDSGAEKK